MGLSSSSIHAAAEILRKGRMRPATPIGHLPETCRPQDVCGAMAIQERLHELLEQDGLGFVVGTKIGCTTKVMQEYVGMDHPCLGAIFESTIFRREAELDFDSYLHVGVECEIAATLSSEIRPENAPYSIKSITDSVESLHTAIEIVDDRYSDFMKRVPDGNTWIADDFFGAGAVLGEPVTSWKELDLATVQGKMRIDGEEVGVGYGRDIINGHPLEALVWLANYQAERNRNISKGWVVLLGSVVQTNWVSKGSTVTVEIDGLGRAEATFE